MSPFRYLMPTRLIRRANIALIAGGLVVAGIACTHTATPPAVVTPGVDTTPGTFPNGWSRTQATSILNGIADGAHMDVTDPFVVCGTAWVISHFTPAEVLAWTDSDIAINARSAAAACAEEAR